MIAKKKGNLKELFDEANRKARSAELAQAEAASAAAAYNESLLRELSSRNAPPGWSLDVHGDGKLKPAGECATPTCVKG